MTLPAPTAKTAPLALDAAQLPAPEPEAVNALSGQCKRRRKIRRLQEAMELTYRPRAALRVEVPRLQVTDEMQVGRARGPTAATLFTAGPEKLVPASFEGSEAT